MTAPIHTTRNWRPDQYDMVIDVRSPSEFADDHIEGAVNLPALFDDERAVVGTLYRQTSAFAARKTGAAIMSHNIANHLETFLQDKPASFRPLIHCWRGGQRSRAFALVMSEIGWTTHLLEGGYKAYRRGVLDKIKSLPELLNLIIIAGRTGSGKTDLLQTLKQNQQQILDLEDLAAHRGSLLGQIPGRLQPGQRLFESRLVHKLMQFDPSLPVFIESESSRIGNLQIPASLWRVMTNAPLVTLDVPVSARAAYLVSVYERLTLDPSDLLVLIDGMVRRHGYDITGEWKNLLDQKDWHSLAESLLTAHYDPAYDQSVSRHDREELLYVLQKDFSEEQREKTVHKIMRRVDKSSVTREVTPQ